MASCDIEISRSVLANTHKDLKAAVPGLKPMRQAWVHHSHGDHWDGHVLPFGQYDRFYWSGKAHNAYDARQKMWAAWNREHQVIDENKDAA